MTQDSANTGGNALSVAPATASPANDANPEFLDAAGLHARFGIKRSLEVREDSGPRNKGNKRQ
jgi:hypothetical protein